MTSTLMISTNAVPVRYMSLSGICLLLFAGLSLNNIAFRLVGSRELLSPLAMLWTVILIVRFARPENIVPLYMLFVATMASYLFFGFLPGIMAPGINTRYVYTYSATILMVSAIYFWLASAREAEIESILTLLKHILLVSCIFIILPDNLQPLPPVPQGQLALLPDADEGTGRAAGFFGNPNEAGAAAVYCLILIVALPSSAIIFKFVQFGIALLALLMTFSKAAMLSLLVLSILYLLTRGRLMSMVLVVLAATTAALTLWFAYEQGLFDLSLEQRTRLIDVINLASGEINTQTTTGRDQLVQIAIERIKEVFPMGAGLGTFHSMVGGFRSAPGGIEIDLWLGTHNTFLLVLGEAGLVPFLMLLMFLGLLLIRGASSRYRDIVIGFTLEFIVQMLASHGALLLRFSNVHLAIAIALAASPHGRQLIRCRGRVHN